MACVDGRELIEGDGGSAVAASEVLVGGLAVDRRASVEVGQVHSSAIRVRQQPFGLPLKKTVCLPHK